MSTNASITVVTPVLNGATYLPQMLKSLSLQRFSGWEHIIVDGGSTDGSLDILREWCGQEARAQLVQADGLGLYPSILRGLQMGKGQLMAWLNSDDLYAPWAMHAAWDYHIRTGAAWITGYPGCWDRDGVLRYVRPYGWYPRHFIRAGWFHERLLGFLQQESMFFSRPLFSRLQQADLDEIASFRLAGDWILWRKLAEYAPLSVLPTVVSGFRQHRENLSSNNLEAYLQEVRMHGGVFLPSLLARLAGRGFRAMSALHALRQVRVEEGHLGRSVDLAKDDEIAVHAERH